MPKLACVRQQNTRGIQASNTWQWMQNRTHISRHVLTKWGRASCTNIQELFHCLVVWYCGWFSLSGMNSFHRHDSHWIFSNSQTLCQTFHLMHIIMGRSITIECPSHLWVVQYNSTSNQHNDKHGANIPAMDDTSIPHQSTTKAILYFWKQHAVHASLTLCFSSTNTLPNQ